MRSSEYRKARFLDYRYVNNLKVQESALGSIRRRTPQIRRHAVTVSVPQRSRQECARSRPKDLRHIALQTTARPEPSPIRTNDGLSTSVRAF